jgi:hypothetical protein
MSVGSLLMNQIAQKPTNFKAVLRICILLKTTHKKTPHRNTPQAIP